MATNNDVDTIVKRSTLNMRGLDDITDDELPPITKLIVVNEAREGEPTPEHQPLSPRIGECENLTELCLLNCSSIPSDIVGCTKLSTMHLYSRSGNDDNDCRIELPEDSILPKLTTLCLSGGGIWNTGDIITWLATSTGITNLELNLLFSNISRDTVNQLMRELQNNKVFIEKFKHKLEQISFLNCNLNEDDALAIIVNIKPLYPRLSFINLQNNNIEGLETIAAAVRETPPANNNLLGLILADNPVSRNLNDPNSSDHPAMMCLLKYLTHLGVIKPALGNTAMTYSSLIDYRLMMNASQLRYLVDDGHGGTRRSGILPVVMIRAYTQRQQDPTVLFTFLREGSIFTTHEL